MLKLYLTLVLLGAFLGQSQGAVGDKCYDCIGTTAIDADKCLTPDSSITPTKEATADKPYCYTSVVGAKTTRGITSLNLCGADDALVTTALTSSTCSGALCNNDNTATGFSPTVKDCPVIEVTPECEECKEPTDCADPTECPDCPEPTKCPEPTACQDSNSGTKANRGFGVIMTSVSLSYVITKFL